MTWQLIFTEQYNRRAAKFLKRHPDVETQYAKTLELLEVNYSGLKPPRVEMLSRRFSTRDLRSMFDQELFTFFASLWGLRQALPTL